MFRFHSYHVRKESQESLQREHSQTQFSKFNRGFKKVLRLGSWYPLSYIKLNVQVWLIPLLQLYD